MTSQPTFLGRIILRVSFKGALATAKSKARCALRWKSILRRWSSYLLASSRASVPTGYKLSSRQQLAARVPSNHTIFAARWWESHTQKSKATYLPLMMTPILRSTTWIDFVAISCPRQHFSCIFGENSIIFYISLLNLHLQLLHISECSGHCVTNQNDQVPRDHLSDLSVISCVCKILDSRN